MVLILLLFSAGLNAQFYEYGQDAGRLRWYQLETPNYSVIFPDGVDSLANAFARRLESYYPYLGKPLDHRHTHIPVIIHNESSFSNGVFVWAPKRLEIFTNPDPNGYNQDWLTQLAIHEGRHAVQIDKLNQGLSRGLYYLGGEQLVGAMAIFLPYWYLEGDAVDAETRLSGSGRGRQPSFEMELKAQMLESDHLFSFSKATMGSFRHHIPNHYQLGYLMVRYGRRTYGDKFWIDFQNYAARKPYLLNPTFFSMRKYGLKSKRQFYHRALMKYKARWILSDAGRIHTPYDQWNGEKSRHYTSYNYPHMVSDSLLFAYKTGKDQIPEFMIMGSNGREKELFRPGYLSSGRISFSGSHVVWDEYVPDTRWSNRNYSVVRSYEIGTGKVSTLGRRTRYYAPDLSGDESRIVAIEQSEMQKFSLVIMGLDGVVQRKVPSPGNRFIQHPSWMDGDSAVVLIQSVGEGKSAVQYSLTTDAWETLFDAGIEDISHPVVYGNMIFFSATFSGIDNIYCHDLTDHETYQVTSARFGAFQPQISGDGSRLFYSNYTSGGYKIAEMNLEEGLWKPMEATRSHEEQLDYQPSDEEQGILTEISKQDTSTFPVKRYHKLTHLFNIHSWLPLYVDYLNPDLTLSPEQLPVSPGLSLVSQNHLSTAVSQLGYEYRDGYHLFHSGIKLKGRYPVVNLFFDYGGEPRVFLMNEEDSAMALPRGMNFTAQTYIPFRLNTGKFLSLIQPRIDYNYQRDLQYIEEDELYRPGVHYLHYSLSATIYLRKGERDILPRLGLSSSLGYFHAPLDHRVYGAVSSARMTGYLPGFLKHNTIKLTMQHQKQYPLDMSKPAFINLISMPRGQRGIYGERLTSYSADYLFPILCPDLAISSIVYLKRIRGALWADYMEGTNVVVMDPSPHYENRNYFTFGTDLIADVNLLRLPFPLSLGVRFIFYPQTWTDKPQTWSPRLQFIYTIDIN